MSWRKSKANRIPDEAITAEVKKKLLREPVQSASAASPFPVPRKPAWAALPTAAPIWKRTWTKEPATPANSCGKVWIRLVLCVRWYETTETGKTHFMTTKIIMAPTVPMS